MNLGDSFGEAGLSKQRAVLLCKFDRVHSSGMGAGSILRRDYDWVGVAFSTNENSSDESVFSRGSSVATEDGDSTSQACIMEDLFQGDSIKLILFSCSDAQNVMLVYQRGCKRW